MKTNYRRRSVALLLILAVCVTFANATVYAAAAEDTVRVGCFPLNGFFNIAEDKTVSGYGADYTSSVFEYAGRNYEYIVYSSWVEALDALSRNEIDMLAPSQHTPERDAIYAFDSFPIGTEYGALLTLSTNEALVYEDYTSFDGLTVGVVPSLVFLDDFMDYEARNHFTVNLKHYKDTSALIAAMNAGEVDAALVNMMVKTPAMKLLARFGAAPIYYMFSSAGADLCEEINLAIDKMTSEHPELQGMLNDRYFSDFYRLPFSKEELDFIAASGTLNVACGAGFPPFSYIDKETGEITGVGCSIVKRVAEISGLEVSLHAIPFGVDGQTFIQENSIAIIPGVEADKTSSQNGGFSQSYLTIYKYFIGKHDRVFDKTAGAKIACLNYSQVQLDNWQAAYPNFEFVRYGAIDDCVKAVHNGAADYLLNDRYTMQSVLAAPQNKDLKIFPDEIVVSQVCFKVTLTGEEGTLLTSILNKSICYITESDKEKLISDFTAKNSYQYTVKDFLYQYRYQLIILACILAGMVIAIGISSKAKKKMRLATEENESKLRSITNNINGGVVVLKLNDGLSITYANDGFLNLVGCTREQFVERGKHSYLLYVHTDDLDKINNAINAPQQEMSLKLRIKRTDGAYVPALFNYTVGENKSESKELFCVILDLTEQEKLIEQLRMEKQRTELLLGCVEEIIYEVNLQDHSITTSSSFYERFGWTLPPHFPELREDFIRKTWEADSESIDKLLASTRYMLSKKEPSSVIIQLNSKKDKRYIWCEIVQHPFTDKDGTVVSVVGLIRNVDTQIAERERLIEQTQHDPLTGLYNKDAFEMLVSDALKQMPDKNHAIIFIDLDHFKDLNDTLGHMVGDRVLCEAADKLRVIFSNYDLVARFGGDEFCIFAKNIPVETLRGKMDWLIEKLREKYSGEKGTVQITCSCGVACTEEREGNYKTLMHCADKALYYSKENGRDRYTFFRDISSSFDDS